MHINTAGLGFSETYGNDSPVTVIDGYEEFHPDYNVTFDDVNPYGPDSTGTQVQLPCLPGLCQPMQLRTTQGVISPSSMPQGGNPLRCATGTQASGGKCVKQIIPGLSNDVLMWGSVGILGMLVLGTIVKRR
jgi:hypothetical protein